MEISQPENKLLYFIKSNSKILIYSFILLFLILSFSLWHINKSQKEDIKISEDFIKAQILIKNEKNDEAKEILSKLVKIKNSPYSSLSLFLIIENKLFEDKKKILDYFDFIIKNNSFKDEDLNLIKFKKAIFISDIKKEQEIIELLKPIINSNSVWKPQVLNYLGDFYYSFNQLQKAKQYYTLLAETDSLLEMEAEKKMELLKND